MSASRREFLQASAVAHAPSGGRINAPPASAKGVGLRTAFVTRPHEFGPGGKPDLKADASADLSATDFNDLVDQLGA